MTHQTDQGLLTLAGLAHRCTRETELFFQRQPNDPRYCYELFRRAILDRDQRAWELIYAQYRPQVGRWVERHSAFATSGEEVGYVVNRAFEKMWVALTPEKFDRFPDLKSVLRYLQLCVHSVILDQVRAVDKAVLDVSVEDVALDMSEDIPPVEDQVLDRVGQEDFWRAINARLHDEKERRVVYASFALAMKPREIYARSEGLFDDIKEVYRVKENVLARLRRDSELKRIFGVDA
jgi:DNA-directed RNA polymerase specialized sigma24 family protein